jgi:D-methionine transport system substrate-binding protein
VDIAPINGNYAILGGLKVKDALAAESADSIAATTYANILTVRVGDENRPELKDLADILKGDEIKAFINNTYDGAVVPSK